MVCVVGSRIYEIFSKKSLEVNKINLVPHAAKGANGNENENENAYSRMWWEGNYM